MLGEGGAFRFINEGSVRARGDEIGRLLAKLGKNLSDGIGRFALLRKVCAGGNCFNPDCTFSTNKDRSGAFAENRAARRVLERVHWRARAKQTAFSGGGAQEPGGFLGGHGEALVKGGA